MARKERSEAGGGKASTVFSEEEKAAMREAVRERAARKGSNKVSGEDEVLAKISEMKGSDRAIAERLHKLIKSAAPSLGARTWYGMPAYTKDDEVFCWFTPAAKFKARYATFSLSDEAKLDEGHLWPIAFALTELNSAEEAKIVALLKKAMG
jgi:hypothetical protein